MSDAERSQRPALIPSALPQTPRAEAVVLCAFLLCAFLLVAAVAGSCTPASSLRAQTPPVSAPPTIPDAQPAVDAPLFVGQNTFAAPLGHQSDLTPALTTVRANGGNSGVIDGPGPLGTAPVIGSTAAGLRPPLLWDRRGSLVTGCQQQVAADLLKNCLASVDPATLTVQARWLPPEQDLNLDSVVLDDQRRLMVTTAQNHLLVVALPGDAGSIFRTQRDIDLTGYLAPSQMLAFVTADGAGNVWFATGARLQTGDAASSATVGYLTPADRIAVTRLSGMIIERDMAVDQNDVYIAASPAAGSSLAGPSAAVYGLTASGGLVQTLWRAAYDAGGARKPGRDIRGTGSPIVLLGPQYLAITDESAPQAHLLVYLRGMPAPDGHHATEPRLLCTVSLFTAGASAVGAPLVAFSGGTTNSVLVANGYNAPPPLASVGATDAANNMNTMGSGLTRVDVVPDGSGCTVGWTAQIRMKTAPVLSSNTGLVYGYTQDEQRAAAGSYVWYFVAMDYHTGRVVWRQRAGAGGTKNDNRQPLALGGNGVLYQSVPQGLVWMRDLAQRP